ncbi:AsmA family protein [Microvirga thermotolerans]|uniref:AsmA family protein n=1 Tax=Microvirga thermotolerans TaxID=2651334 RepID=A0A5P9JVU8_9HYPH|nr:AsmA-like C-terminal region-containing protein [Microvirga thermotolerans]QFU16221.1 AsmA family protein [Microvirga thermotolerans]
MSRRLVLFIALATLALLGAASAPWTLSPGGLAAAVTEHLQGRYGLSVAVSGRSTFALLPTPRVKFEEVTLSYPKHSLKAEGATLRGELRILPLFMGRIELSEIALNDARITAAAAALRGIDWARLFRDRMGETHARRLIVAASSIRWTDLPASGLSDLNLLVNWNGVGEPLHAVGSAVWRGERVAVDRASFDPVRLASDQLSPLALTLSVPAGRLSIQGEAQIGDDPRFTGQSLLSAASMRDFLRWSGIGLPFGSLMQAVAIEGDLSVNRRRISWPSVTVTLGSDTLEGTLAVRLDAERPVIAGTLAAERLNLSDFVQPLAQARAGSGSWSEEAINLTQVTGNDLDLRLSAMKAQLGRLHLGDMAASILVRPGRIEASLGRADFHEGTLKGRLALIAFEKGVDVKSQGLFDGVNIASFLSEIGQPRWITGSAQGQFALEGAGATPAEVVRQAQGRSTVTVKEGELVGIALNDAVKRVEKRPLSASLSWKGGRTPFDQVQAQLAISGGIGEIVDSRISTPTLSTSLHGKVSLPERGISMKVEVSPLTPSPPLAPAIVFDVSGGWDDIAITPDARSLIERSGAARPLLGVESAPFATAQ